MDDVLVLCVHVKLKCLVFLLQYRHAYIMPMHGRNRSCIEKLMHKLYTYIFAYRFFKNST